MILNSLSILRLVRYSVIYFSSFVGGEVSFFVLKSLIHFGAGLPNDKPAKNYLAELQEQ